MFTVENLAAKPDQLKKYMIENGPSAGTSKRFDDEVLMMVIMKLKNDLIENGPAAGTSNRF